MAALSENQVIIQTKAVIILISAESEIPVEEVKINFNLIFIANLKMRHCPSTMFYHFNHLIFRQSPYLHPLHDIVYKTMTEFRRYLITTWFYVLPGC